MSLPGDDAVCWIPSCPLPSVCFPSDRVPGLVWLRLSYDHGWIRSGCDFVLFFLFAVVFILFSSCDIGESGLGPAPVLFLDS